MTEDSVVLKMRESLRAAEAFVAEELDRRRDSVCSEADEYIRSASTTLASIRNGLAAPDEPLDQLVADIQNRPGLERLNEDIDQLAAVAGDLCSEAKTLLDLAWWFTEEDLRRGLGSCGHNPRAREGHGYCTCCAHFDELRAKAEHIRRLL